MRIRSFAAGIALIAALLPAAARAGFSLNATWTATIGGVAITLTGSGATCTDTNPLGRVPGAGFVACPEVGLVASGWSTPTSFDISLTMPAFQMQAFTTGGVIPIGTMATLLSGSQNITGNLASVAATMAIEGTVALGAPLHIPVSMWSQPVGNTLARIPLRFGEAGVYTASFTLSSVHYVTVDFYAWTHGTRTFTGLTSDGHPLPAVVAMGSLRLASDHVGELTLVAPSRISVDGPLLQRRTASFASLHMVFVPEPGALLLIGSAGLGLWLAAQKGA